MARAERFRLALAFTAICVIWGSTYLAIKVGLQSFDPFFYAGMRYSFAVVIAFTLARARGVTFGGPLRRWLPAFGVGVLLVAFSNGIVFWAETSLDSGFTAVLITTSPVWTALLSPAAGERAPGPLGWGGIALGFAGTTVLLAPWQARAVTLWPALAVQVSVVVWAGASLWVRRIRDRYHPMALSVAQMAAGAAILLTVAAVRGRALVGPVTLPAVAALSYLVVFGSVVAFASYFYLLHHWDAARVSTSTYINPVVAVTLGALVLGEPVSLRMVAGAAIILCGVALVLRERRMQ